MKLNLKHLIAIAVLISFAIITISCRKHLQDCTGNCAVLTFEGTVFNKSTNQPIPNQPVKVQMSYSGFCLLCTTLDVASTKTDADGRFKIVTEFDTNYFKQNYYLSIQSILPNSYIQYPIAVGSDFSYTNSNNYRMYNYDMSDSSFKNLLFTYYSKTTLNLNLHRTAVAIVGDSSLDLDYKMGNGESVSGFQQSKTNKDTTIIIYTGANVLTNITATKYDSAFGYINKTDSIICSLTGKNSIDIYY